MQRGRKIAKGEESTIPKIRASKYMNRCSVSLVIKEMQINNRLAMIKEMEQTHICECKQ